MNLVWDTTINVPADGPNCEFLGTLEQLYNVISAITFDKTTVISYVITICKICTYFEFLYEWKTTHKK